MSSLTACTKLLWFSLPFFSTEPLEKEQPNEVLWTKEESDLVGLVCLSLSIDNIIRAKVICGLSERSG